MNPYHEPFCISSENKQIMIPIQINQTNPKLIDLLRVDLEGSYNETIRIGASELKRLQKIAMNEQRPKDGTSTLILRYLSKKTGRYTLEKVVDETGLEVRPRFSELLVVPCPYAHVKSSSGQKCKDDLSDVSFEITGTPPLTLRYNKTTDGSLIEHKSLQSIQPDGFSSPFLRQESIPSPLVQSGKVDISWARPCKMSIPVNEKMSRPGEWIYSVDSIEDALGNIVSYKKQFDEDGKVKSRHQDLQQSVFVQDRPRVSFGCDTQRPLKVAKGQTITLPLRFGTVGKGHPRDATYSVEYLFTPQESLLENGEHNPETQQLLEVNLKSPWQRSEVTKSGLYTLKSVKAGWCDGEVDEPASCILEHPPEPEVSIIAESITDKCDRMPIGLRADFDFVGTPPFTIDYVIESKGKPSEFKQTKSENRRYQLELKPRNAGHYTYRFNSLTDQYYQARRISEILEVDVKPSANAELMLDGTAKRPRLCLGDQAEFSVRFTGEPPWSLEYEVVHGGKKTKSKIDNVSEKEYTFRTTNLQSGGDYSLVLVSVSDSRNCPESLKEEVKFHVRHQRPKAGFGTIEGKRTAQAVEDSALALPIRLTGEKPWRVEVKNIDDQYDPPKEYLFENPNTEIQVNRQGTYQIHGVRDVICAGQVEEGASKFAVSWRDRPHLRISESPTLKKVDNSHFRKEDVCEGDEDYLDIAFSGRFSLAYLH
jgi:nucleoporin POM152